MATTGLDDLLAADARLVLGGAPDELTPLAHSRLDSVTRGVWRVRLGDRTVIAKVVGPRTADPRDASRRPDSYRFWLREAHALGHPLLAPYRDAGIRPPHLLHRAGDGESLRLWLEDAAAGATPGVAMPPEQLGEVARRLGRAQASLVEIASRHDESPRGSAAASSATTSRNGTDGSITVS